MGQLKIVDPRIRHMKADSVLRPCGRAVADTGFTEDRGVYVD